MEKFGLYYDIFDRKVGNYEGKITFYGRNRQKHDKNMNDRDIFPQCGIMRVACPVLPGKPEITEKYTGRTAGLDGI